MILSNTSDPATSADTLPGLLSEALYWPLMVAILFLDFFGGLIAAAANIVTIAVYRKLGYADSTNISLTALAISDLGVAVTTITSILAILLSNIPNTPFTLAFFYSFTAAPHVIFLRSSALITTYLSVERYLCISFPLKIKSIITPMRTLVSMVTSYVAVFSLWPLIFLGNPVGWKFYPHLNRSLLSVLPSTDPIRNSVYVGYMFYASAVLPMFTIAVVVLFTILLAVTLNNVKTWREANKSTSMAARQAKEERASKMVVAIATVFVVSSIPSCFHVIFDIMVPEFSLTGRYVYLYTLTGMTFLLVDCINCTANVIIYYKMSSKFRQAMRNMFSRND